MANLPEISGKLAIDLWPICQKFLANWPFEFISKGRQKMVPRIRKLRQHLKIVRSELASEIAMVWSMEVIFSPLESSGPQLCWNWIAAAPISISGSKTQLAEARISRS